MVGDSVNLYFYMNQLLKKDLGQHYAMPPIKLNRTGSRAECATIGKTANAPPSNTKALLQLYQQQYQALKEANENKTRPPAA